MKFILFLLIILIIYANVFAEDRIDVIYLKNGSIIKGTIIEQIPGKSIKIETKGGSIFVYKMEEIERITKEGIEQEPYIPQSNIKTVGNFFVSFGGSGSYYSYINDNDFKISEAMDSKGTFAYTLHGSIDYILASNNIALGGEINLSNISTSKNWGTFFLDSYHSTYTNYDSYFTDYTISYKAIPVNISFKVTFIPYKITFPYLGFGISYMPMSFSDKGIFHIDTPYDNNLVLPIDSEVSGIGSGFNGFIGLNIDLNNYVSLFAQVDYILTKASKETRTIDHRDIKVTNYTYVSNVYFTELYLYLPEANYGGSMLEFGLKVNLGKLKPKSTNVK